jgi:type VI secretion system VasD/TssJ family lipoprotein
MSRNPMNPAWMRAPAFAALVALVALTSGCGMMGGKKSIQISLEAGADCNNCGKDSSQPLEFAVLQLTDASAITGTSLVQIWGKEKNLFGDALLTRDTGSIIPRSTQPFVYARDPKAKAVLVIGNFCRPDGNCWYYSQLLSRGSKISLKAGASCLGVVTK